MIRGCSEGLTVTYAQVLFRVARILSLAAAASGFCSPAVAAGAEPQDVWVHYDYMVFPPGFTDDNGLVYPNGVSMAPPPAAIDKVVASFAAQGLELHIDPIHNAISGHQVIIPDFYPAWKNASGACVGSDAVSFLALKQKYFYPHGDHPWHYAVFGWSVGLPATSANGNACPFDPICRAYPDPLGTGMSELPGFNFILAIGTLTEGAAIPIGSIPDVDIGGLFMHELGHNFGLEHGGVYPASQGGVYPEECLTQKPNYISVMNFNYRGGIPYAATPGSNKPVDFHLWRLDYSRFQGTTLNEADLNEFAGVGGPPWDTDIVIYCAVGVACTLRGPSYGPIDWNNDGVIESHASGDIDNDSGFANRTLQGFDDWSYVKQQLQIAPDVIDRMPKRAVN